MFSIAVRFLSENIVGTILFLTAVIWIIVGVIISCIVSLVLDAVHYCVIYLLPPLSPSPFVPIPLPLCPPHPLLLLPPRLHHRISDTSDRSGKRS